METIMPTPSFSDLLSCAVDEVDESVTPVVVAERLIDFSLAKREGIEGLDVEMGRVALCYAQRKAAMAMRAMYSEWTEEATGLLRHVRETGLGEKLPAKTDQLSYAIARIKAMLSISLEDIEQGAKDIRDGNTFSLEEVRRELRAASGR